MSLSQQWMQLAPAWIRDFCEPMIIAAKKLGTGKDAYRVADVQDLSFLDDHSFDLGTHGGPR